MSRRWKLVGGEDWDLVVGVSWAVCAVGGLIATALCSIPYHGDVRSWDLVVAVLWLLGAAIVPLVVVSGDAMRIPVKR